MIAYLVAGVRVGDRRAARLLYELVGSKAHAARLSGEAEHARARLRKQLEPLESLEGENDA